MSNLTALQVLQDLFVNTSLTSDLLNAKNGINPQGWDAETIEQIEFAEKELHRLLAERNQ